MDLSGSELQDRVKDTIPNPIWFAGLETRIVPPALDVLRAPHGIIELRPEEMTVSCGAGTPVDELLSELRRFGQYVNLPSKRSGSGTVGGALAVGEGDVHRLGRGHIRDVLLRADFVSSDGAMVRTGGPTVKNVSGFDLCRVLVGSCGRLGLLSTVILRSRPLPLSTAWFEIDAPTWDVVEAVSLSSYRPSSLLWTGQKVFLCFDGHPKDVKESRDTLSRILERVLVEVDGPDMSEFRFRWYVRPGDVERSVMHRPGRCIAEIGTGIIHHLDPQPEPENLDLVNEVETRILRAFDPHDRLNGGSRLWGPRHVKSMQRGRFEVEDG